MSLKNVTKTEKNRVTLEVEIPAADFEQAVQKTYLRMRKRINIPGFRKGKVPRKLIEREYGEGFFYEDAVNDIAGKYIQEAVDESGIELVGQPNVSVDGISKENGVALTLECVVKPEVSIDGYKGIEVEKVVDAVTDEDVDKRAEQLCERNSRLVSVDDRPAQNGDTVTIDFKGFKDDVAFDGGEAENYELELGSGQFIPGFEDQIVGHSTDEEFDINVTFPEDYTVEELAGAPAVFKIKLHEIKYKEVPQLDDDLIKDSTEFETVDEYKADLRQKMQEAAENKANNEVESKLLDAVAEKLQADVPQEMYDERLDEMLRDLESRLAPQGISLEEYFRYTGQSLDSAKSAYEAQAKKQVDLRLALEKIVELENIEVTDEDVENGYQKIADTYNMDVETVKGLVGADGIKQDAAVEKAVQLIKDNAVIK